MFWNEKPPQQVVRFAEFPIAFRTLQCDQIGYGFEWQGEAVPVEGSHFFMNLINGGADWQGQFVMDGQPHGRHI